MSVRGLETRRSMLQTAALAMLGGMAGAQNVGPPQNPKNQLPELAPEMSPAQQERQAKAQNDDRQKRLVADTAKLLQLATQLHEDVEKTTKNVLSMDVVRRAEEIEKLAHGIKDRMRG